MKNSLVKMIMSILLSLVLVVSVLAVPVTATDSPESSELAEETDEALENGKKPITKEAGEGEDGNIIKSGKIGLFANLSGDNLVESFSMTVIASDGMSETVIVNGNDHEFTDLSQLSAIKMSYGLTIPDSLIINAGDTYEIDLPGFYQGSTPNPIDIVAEGKVVAAYEIISGKVIITFKEDVNQLDKKTIDVDLTGSINKNVFETEDEVEVIVPFSDGTSFEAKMHLKRQAYQGEDKKTAGVPYIEKDAEGNPIAANLNPEFIDWTVIVNDNMESFTNAVAFDELGNHLEIDLDSIKVFKIKRNYKNEFLSKELVAGLVPISTTSGFEIPLGDISDAYEITYTTRLIRPDGGGTHEIKNSAGLRHEDGENDIAPVKKAINWSENIPTIKKKGVLSASDPQIIDWEIKYNFNLENLGKINLTDVLDYGEIIKSSIKVYQVTSVDAEGNILAATELDNYSPEKDQNDNLVFPLDAEGKGYYIRFSSDVPIGLKGDVTNTITDDVADEPNSDSASVEVDTIPTGGKIGQQKVDKDGNPYIDWTITLNPERVSAGKVRLADIFDPELLSFDPADTDSYRLVRHDSAGNEEEVPTGYTVLPYTDPQDPTRSGFELQIDHIGNSMYTFHYITYYTMKGMQEPYLANDAEIFFLHEDGTGIGGGQEPITATIEGPISSISKEGQYFTSEDKTKQRIAWRILFNESKIKLPKGTLITDQFTSKNFSFIAGSLTVLSLAEEEGKPDITLVENSDYKFTLTYESGNIIGFEITWGQVPNC